MEHLLGLPPDGSAHGAGIDNLIALVHWLMAVLFVGWGLFYLYTLYRFRKSRNPQASYHGVKSHFSTYVEVGVLVVEVILLIGFSIPMWSKRVDAFPKAEDAVIVRVVAEQFAWNIHYPGRDGKFGKTSITLIDADNPLGLDRTDADAKDDIVTNNNLYLPVNKPVIVNLTSKDVIHSFNLPLYRVKQDAVPGNLIPVWFTPTKTETEIRNELVHSFSIAAAMKKARSMPLPQVTTVRLAKGMNMSGEMIMRDAADNAGSGILSKGDHLDADNITKLMDAGIAEVPARPLAGLDAYVSMAEEKDSAGNTIVASGDPLLEDAVTKLVDAGRKEIMARKASNVDPFMLMAAYKDPSGNVIAAAGDPLSEDLISKLAAAGLAEIAIAPSTPTEIACAQLCGLGHYRMRGYIHVQSPEEFQKWFDGEEAALLPPPAAAEQPQDSTGTAH